MTATNPEMQTRPPLPEDVFVEGGLQKLLEQDFSADLLLPQPNFSQDKEAVDAAYGQESDEIIERLKLPRDLSSTQLSEVVSDELHALRELKAEREQELKRMRTLLAGDAHSLSDEEIDAMSVDELLELKNVGGSIYNLRSSMEYEEDANSWSGKLQNGYANFFTGFGMFGEYVDEPKVAAAQTEHSLAIVEDYKEKIKELKTAILEADKGILEASTAESERQSASEDLQQAEATGDQRAVQRAKLQLERQTLKIEHNLNLARRRLSTSVEIDYRRHQRGFNKLHEMFSKLDEAYAQADANRKLVQKVVIVTIAATTTTLLSGGAAGAFWVPFLIGTAAGGAAAFLSELGEYGLSKGMGLKTDFAASMKNAAWTTVDCALACVGGAWAGATAKIAAQTTAKTGLSRITSMLARRSLPLKMGLKQQLPSTAFYTANDIYTWSRDPSGKTGMDPTKVTEWGAKLGELMLSVVGSHVGHTASARREAMRATATKTWGGAAFSKLGQASTYGLDLSSNIISTKLEIMMAQALTGREFTQQEINQRYLAAWTGWGAGTATERLQARAQALGDRSIDSASSKFKDATVKQRRNSGVGGSAELDAVVEERNGILPQSIKENDFNPATAHRDLRAAELETKFEENQRIDRVTGKPIAETIQPEVDALDRAFRQKKARTKLSRHGKETLSRLASDQVALGNYEGTPESVLAYIDRFEGAVDSKLARTTRQYENHLAGTGPDKGGPIQASLKKLGDGVDWLTGKVIDPVADYGSSILGVVRDKTYFKPGDNDSSGVSFLKNAWSIPHQFVFNYIPQQFMYRGIDQPVASAVRTVSVDGDRLRGPVMHALLVYSGAQALGKGLHFVQRKTGTGYKKPIDTVNFAGEQLQAKRWLNELQQVEAVAKSKGLEIDERITAIREKLEKADKLAGEGYADCNRSNLLVLGLGKPVEFLTKWPADKLSRLVVGATNIQNGQNWFARTMRGANWPGPLEPVGSAWGKWGAPVLHAIATPVRYAAQPLEYAKMIEGSGSFARFNRGEDFPQVPASLKWGWKNTGGAVLRAAAKPARAFGEYLQSTSDGGSVFSRRILNQGAKNELDTQFARALSKVSEMKHVEMHQALEDRLRDAILGVHKVKQEEVVGLVALLHNRRAVSEEVYNEIVKNLTPTKRPPKNDGSSHTKKELKKIHDREGYRMRVGRMRQTPGERRQAPPIYEDAANLEYVGLLTKTPSDSQRSSAPTLFEVYKQQATMELKQPMWRVLGDRDYDINPREVLRSFERLSTVLGHEEAMKFLSKGSEERPSYLRKLHDAAQKATQKGEAKRAKRLQELFNQLSAKVSKEQDIEQLFNRWIEDPMVPQKMFDSLEQRLAEAISGEGEQRLSPESFAAHLRLLYESELIPQSVQEDIITRLAAKTATDKQGQECASLLKKTPTEIANLLPESLVKVPKLEAVHTAWVKQEHLSPLLELAKQDTFDRTAIENHFNSLQRLLGTRQALDLIQNGGKSVLGKLRSACERAGTTTPKSPADPVRARQLENITTFLERFVKSEEQYAKEHGYRHRGPSEKASDEPWIIGSENVEPISRFAQAETFITNAEFDKLVPDISELKQQFEAMQQDFGTVNAIAIFERGSLRDGPGQFGRRGFSGQTRWGKAILPQLRGKARRIQDTNPYQAQKLREVADAIDGFIATERQYRKDNGKPRYAAPEKYADTDPRFGKTQITNEDALALEAETIQLIKSGRVDRDKAMQRLEAIAERAKKRADALVEPRYLKLLMAEEVPYHPYGANAELRRALRIARKNGKVEDGKFVTPKAKDTLEALLKKPYDSSISVDVFLAPTGINSIEHNLARLNPRHWFAETRTRWGAQEVKNSKLTNSEAVDARVREFVENPRRAFDRNGSSAFTHARNWLSLKPLRMYLRAQRASDPRLTPIQREQSLKLLREQIDAPRAKLQKRLEGYEAVQKRSQELVRSLAQAAVRAFDPRYKNAKAIEEVANRVLVEQVQQRQRPNLAGYEYSLWNHKASNQLQDSVNQDPLWSRVADSIDELERAGFGKNGSTPEERSARLASFRGVLDTLWGTADQRAPRP